MRLSFLFCLGFISFSAAEICLADDAQVLPKGRFRARLVSSFSSIQNNFGENGESTALGNAFTKKLDSKLLSALNPGTAATIKQLNAVSPGLGDEVAVDLNTKVETQVLSNIFCLEYGLTDRLSVGFLLPVVHADVDVDAQTSPDQKLSAKINGMNDADPRKAILKQVQSGLNKEAFNALLRNQYRYSDGLQSWSGSGLGDLEIGGKYNYFRSSRLLSSVKAGARLPTGRVDDPDKLFDLGFGDGQADLGIFNMIDAKFTPEWGSTLEVGYTMQLPDTSDTRIPLSSEIPLNLQSQGLSRKLGDYINAEAEMNYQFFKALTVSARYRFLYKMADSYESSDGSDTSVLENGTKELMHAGVFEAEYSNLADVRAGRSRFPFAVAGFFRMPFSGSNIADSRTTGVTLKTYF